MEGMLHDQSIRRKADYLIWAKKKSKTTVSIEPVEDFPLNFIGSKNYKKTHNKRKEISTNNHHHSYKFGSDDFPFLSITERPKTNLIQ